MPDWKPGDIANGHVLGDDLVWRPVTGSPIGARLADSQGSDWKPGDVANGHILGEDLVWRPVEPSWTNTRRPLNDGKVPTDAAEAIRRLCFDGTEPWLILAPGPANGVLAAWDDRLSVIKTGFLAGMVAGSLGGERTASFHFTDITGIEYNSGLANGILEVLTPSYSGGTNKDFWRIGENSPLKQSNTLPIAKFNYAAALDDINELRRRISEVKSGRFKPAPTQQAAPSPTAAAEEIKSLADLRDQGILTEDEFTAKKAQILGL